MNLLASGLTEFVLKPTVIIVAMLAMSYALRRASAATRHFSLTLALVGLLALPVLEEHWRSVLRDPCSRTNSALVRPQHLSFFLEQRFR